MWAVVSHRGGEVRCAASPPPTAIGAYQRVGNLLQPSPPPLGRGCKGKEESWKDAILMGYSSRSPTAQTHRKRRSSMPGTIICTCPVGGGLGSFGTPSALSTPTPARRRAS